jgi:Arc/MetJ family transcription regulator
MAKTLVDIDRDLLDDAMKATGAKTIKETVTSALREAVATAAANEWIEYLKALDPQEREAMYNVRSTAW